MMFSFFRKYLLIAVTIVLCLTSCERGGNNQVQIDNDEIGAFLEHICKDQQNDQSKKIECYANQIAIASQLLGKEFLTDSDFLETEGSDVQIETTSFPILIYKEPDSKVLDDRFWGLLAGIVATMSIIICINFWIYNALNKKIKGTFDAEMVKVNEKIKIASDQLVQNLENFNNSIHSEIKELTETITSFQNDRAKERVMESGEIGSAVADVPLAATEKETASSSPGTDDVAKKVSPQKKQIPEFTPDEIKKWWKDHGAENLEACQKSLKKLWGDNIEVTTLYKDTSDENNWYILSIGLQFQSDTFYILPRQNGEYNNPHIRKWFATDRENPGKSAKIEFLKKLAVSKDGKNPIIKGHVGLRERD